MSDKIFTLDKAFIETQILGIIKIAWSSKDGFEGSLDKKFFKDVTELKIDNNGIGSGRIGNTQIGFRVNDMQMKDLGAALDLGEAEILGVEIEAYPTPNGMIHVEGEVKRSVGPLFEFGVGGAGDFSIENILKLNAGLKKGINALRFRGNYLKGVEDCVFDSTQTEADCRSHLHPY
jgi:hypothetical protein